MEIAPRVFYQLLGIHFRVNVWILVIFRGVNPRVLLNYEFDD